MGAAEGRDRKPTRYYTGGVAVCWSGEVRTDDTVYLFRIDAEMLEVLEEGLDIDMDVEPEDDLNAEED